MVDVVGRRVAEEALIKGTLFTPQEAKAIGMVDQLCSIDELQPNAGFFEPIEREKVTFYFSQVH